MATMVMEVQMDEKIEPPARSKKSPATQLREMLASSRRAGIEFDMAWEKSWKRVKWPHDTFHRRTYKSVLLAQRDDWREAYERTGESQPHLLALLSAHEV